MLVQFFTWLKGVEVISTEELIKWLALFGGGLLTRWWWGLLKPIVFRGKRGEDYSSLRSAINRPEVKTARPGFHQDEWSVEDKEGRTMLPRLILGRWQRVPKKLVLTRLIDPSVGSNNKYLQIRLRGNGAGNIMVGDTNHAPDFSKKVQRMLNNDAWAAYFRHLERQEVDELKKRRLDRLSLNAA